MGWFTSIFPVHLIVNSGNALSDTLKAVKEQLRNIPNKGIGYGVLKYLSKDQEIKEELHQGPSQGIMFNYLGQVNEFKQNEELLITSSDISTGVSICPDNKDKI